MESPFNPEYQNKNIDAKIIAALERIAEVYRVLLWEKSKKIKLSPIQIQILIYLNYHDLKECTINSLASEFNMTPPTISDAVKVLINKNLVRKIKNLKDLRYQFLKVTSKGRKIVQFVNSFSDDLVEVVEQLEQTQKEVFLSSLLNIIASLNQKKILITRRMCFTCSFFQKKNGEFYCTLLDMKLVPKDLRIDCPEHKPV